MLKELKNILNNLTKLREDTIYSYEKTELTKSINKLEKLITYYEDDGK